MIATGSVPVLTSASAAARSSTPPDPSLSAVVCTASARSACNALTSFAEYADWSSSTIATRTWRVVGRWLPKTEAKIEKNMIGSANVSACATRSRLRLIQPIRRSVPIIRGAPARSGQ